MSAPRVVSLFSGAGGLDIGFAMAGYLPVFANEIDSFAAKTYESWVNAASVDHPHLRLEGHRVAVGDITRVENIPGLGEAEVVIGGPPCQGFSVAGKMDPNDPRSKHVWNFLEVVKRVQPVAFVMENVKSLAVNLRWSGLKADLIRRAEGMGYKTSLHVLNASHYGVPQARERMFLVGVRDKSSSLPVPNVVTASNPPPLESALESLPAWGEPGNNTLCTARVTPAKNPVLRKSPFAGMLFNGQGRPMDLRRPAPTLPASMGGNRTPIIDQHQFAHRGTSWIAEYHSSLIAGADPIDRAPDHLRRITVEEAAAIQSFPSDIAWQGPQSARYRQIGNAVPPILGYHVAIALRNYLGFDPSNAADSFLGLAPDMYHSKGEAVAV